jgi:predicted MFS family arabinose efflux permease
MLYGLLTLILAGTRWYWAAVPLLALTSGLIMLFNISAISLRQAIVPNEMLGRVSSTLNVLVNAATPLGVLLGGVMIERTGNVALVYGAIGLLVFLIALAFSFTPLGHAEQYLPRAEGA